jgi:hypothetical protein
MTTHFFKPSLSTFPKLTNAWGCDVDEAQLIDGQLYQIYFVSQIISCLELIASETDKYQNCDFAVWFGCSHSQFYVALTGSVDQEVSALIERAIKCHSMDVDSDFNELVSACLTQAIRYNGGSVEFRSALNG